MSEGLGRVRIEPGTRFAKMADDASIHVSGRFNFVTSFFHLLNFVCFFALKAASSIVMELTITTSEQIF
jgi:hypothetical protein